MFIHIYTIFCSTVQSYSHCPVFYRSYPTMSTFLTTNVQFYSPMSTFFCYESTFLFINVHFFWEMSSFISQHPLFFSIKIYFSLLIPALFIFKSLTKYNKKLETKISPCFEFIFYFRYYRFAISSNNILLIICGLACPFEAFMI